MTGWTDAEKVSLLFAIIESNGASVQWSTVKLPANRTQKACMHMLTKLREVSKAEGTPNADANTDTNNAMTPKKTKTASAATTPRKRKSNDDNGGDDEGGVPDTPTPRKRRTPKKTIKAEEADADAEMEAEAERAELALLAELDDAA